jgi:mRNA interferase MazF
MVFSAGDVVLVPFPYRDRLAERARPAVVISATAYNRLGDVVVAAVTSHVPRFAMDFALADSAAAGLKTPSTVRMLLATVAVSRVVLQVGQLTDRDWTEVQAKVSALFEWP